VCIGRSESHPKVEAGGLSWVTVLGAGREDPPTSTGLADDVTELRSEGCGEVADDPFFT